MMQSANNNSAEFIAYLIPLCNIVLLGLNPEVDQTFLASSTGTTLFHWQKNHPVDRVV